MKKRALFIVAALILCAALALLAGQFIVLEKRYQAAGELLVEGQYEKAQAAYELLGNYKDSTEKARNILRDRDYRYAMGLMAQGNYEDAMIAFKVLGDYKDSAERAAEAKDAFYAWDYA